MGMEQSAEMLGSLIGKSMNLGPEWSVVEVEFKDGQPTGDEPHIYIARTPGHAIECPVCGCRRGVYDTRSGEWRHLNIWQYKTIIRCDVPRTDCPDCGVKTARVPWASDDAANFTALFEAHVPVMAMAGTPASGIANALGASDGALWRMLGKLAERARSQADFDGAARVGAAGTAR